MTPLAALLPLLLGAAGPHAVNDAELVVHAPRLEALSHLKGFLGPASERSILLQPRSYAPDFHPLFTVDPFDKEALLALGIDPAAPATLSFRGRERFTCTGVKSAAIFEKAAKEKLEAAGNPSTVKVQGTTVHLTNLEDHPIAAYVLKGGEACAWAGGILDAKEMAEFSKLPGHASPAAVKALAGVPGVLQVQARGVSVGLDGKGSEIVAEGHTTTRKMSLALMPAAPSPFAGLTPSGLFAARFRVTPPSLAGFLKEQIQAACGACDQAAFAKQLDALSEVLDGDAVMRIDHLEPGTSLSRPAARLNGLRFGMVVSAKDAARARAFVEALAKASPAHSSEEGAIIPLDAGEIRVEVHGKMLSFGNDPSALAAMTPVLSAKPVAVTHALEVRIDPNLAGKALRQISLMDVLGNKELAGLFAFGTEFGPLLGVSDAMELWAQPHGEGTQFHLRWGLRPGSNP